jgi:hypothetical protein
MLSVVASNNRHHVFVAIFSSKFRTIFLIQFFFSVEGVTLNFFISKFSPLSFFEQDSSWGVGVGLKSLRFIIIKGVII